MTDDEYLQELRDDLFTKCERETFEYQGRELVIREMNVREYGAFTQFSATEYDRFVPFVIKQVCTPDGRQVFGEAHVDTLLEQPSRDSIVSAMQEAFMVVNGFKAPKDGPVDKDVLRAILLGADSDEEAIEGIRKLVSVDEADEDAEGN